jgi:hypothetical protein
MSKTLNKIQFEKKLRNLYIRRHKTSKEIGEILGLSSRTVCKYLKKYGIEINRNQRKFEKIKGKEFTQEQRDIIIGTLLGDGSISKHGRTGHRLSISHCAEQKNLVLWKKKHLFPFIGKLMYSFDKRDNSLMWTIRSYVHKEFDYYYNLFYHNGKKEITEILEQFITPLSLAVWYFDDGSLNKVSAKLSTEGFTEKENHILQEILMRKFNIEAKVRKAIHNEKEYFYLAFNKADTQKFLQLTECYKIKCMEYKWGKR